MKKWQFLRLATIILLLFLWEGLVRVLNIPNYILPGSFEVLSKLVMNISLILGHATITLLEALVGLLLGVILALVLSIITVYSQSFKKIVYPLIVASQSVPKIAIAPLLIIWFGTGISSKVVISVIMGFFPIVINFSTGLENVDSELIDFFKVYHARKWQVFLKIRVPSALPYFFAGIKVSATLCFIGAVVGEFISADSGLGYLIIQADNMFDISLEFASVVFLALMANLLFWIISFIERKIIYW